MKLFSIVLQVIVIYISFIWTQQFTFNNNAPVPPRFLLPGGFPVNQPQPHAKRLNSETDNSMQRVRRPLGRARAGIPPQPSLVPLDPELLSSPSSPRTFQPTETSSIQPRPVVEEEEDNTEDDVSPQISTIAAPINAPTAKPFRPSIQFRPTKPQFFANTNIIDEDDNDFQTTKAQPPQIPTTVQEPQFQRKQAPRVQGFRPPSPPAPQQPAVIENKISRQFEKPIRTKFEKSEIPEKRIKKPVAQVLRRYREDNPDGSITWGFENDDGSFKEETIGNDCVTKGKYGYIDPDGVRREYSYSSGLPCDKNKLEPTEEGNSPAGYIDYSSNKVVLPNGDSVDLNNMVKNRARKPVGQRFKNQ